MKSRRTPFYGDPEDRALLGSMGDGSEDQPKEEPLGGAVVELGTSPGVETTAPPKHHPNYREIGAEVPLGFIGHQGENRKQRLTGVATWSPKDHGDHGGDPRVPLNSAVESMPTRRELLAQRQRQRRGKLDPELRRIQREKAKTK